jgi:tRNA threonylcarbamoyladenosine biosynthesis protein TsaE
MRRFEIPTETEMRALGASLAREFAPGDIVFLEGELGAGKTTLVRGLLEAMGHLGPVRSPTFNLVQTFATNPPILHADLYRVRGAEGIGLEDYFDTHISLIEWPDRAHALIDPADAWHIRIAFVPEGRVVEVSHPSE